MRFGLVAFALLGCGRLDFSSAHQVSDALLATPDVLVDAGSDLLAGCALHLPMDEASWAGSAAVIDTCNGFRGTAGGGADVTTDPTRGTVGNFVGGTSCIDVPDDPKLRGGSAMTLSAWVKPTELSPAGFGVISKRTDYQTNSEYAAFIWAQDAGSGSANVLYVDVTDTRGSDSTIYPDNAWHQFTVAYDGSAALALVYTDGVMTGALQEPTSIAPPATEPDLSVGCLPLSGPAQSFVGELDEIVIWDRVLSADDVAGWYQQTLK
jgi:Concanavalin A-like lectin/glucanases superfamily